MDTKTAECRAAGMTVEGPTFTVNLSLSKAALNRTQKGLTGIQGLSLGFRDYDLFEWSCCQVLCDAPCKFSISHWKPVSTMRGPVLMI